MNYIELLTSEEKSILCGLISGKEFKELFKSNEQQFIRIQNGFRAKSLTEKRALSIAITNIGKPFIADWVNIKVDTWLKQIQENIEMLEEDGTTHYNALATTMLEGFFADNVDLYLKLAGIIMDDKERTLLRERMESIKIERMKNTEVSDRIMSLEEEKQKLVEQVEVAQKRISSIKAEYEQKIQQITQDKDSLASMLTEAQKRISELESIPIDEKDDNTEYLKQFDDTDASLLPSVGSEEIVSLCGISTDYKGQKWLIRYADLDNNGRYQVFRKNDEISPYYTNREKIYYKDGPFNDGFYGIWTWSSIPNKNDPSKSIEEASYNMNLDAIEVVIIPEVASFENMIKLLKLGIECQHHSRRIMFAINTSRGQFMGALCNAKELNISNGKISFADDCVEVPVYGFTFDDIIRMDNELIFYKNAFAGIPMQLYQLISPLDIVKGIVFSSISWTTYKTRDLTRTQWRAFKEFLGGIPVDEISKKIEIACRCSDSTAKELLDSFLTKVSNYIDGSSIEDEIIRAAISASAELQERTKALIRADWESENGRLIVEAQTKLDLLNSQVKSANDNLIHAEEEYKKTKAEMERLESIIAEKVKLAENVETAVADRIKNARENAADFIASMAFFGSQPIQTTIAETPVVTGDSFESRIAHYHIVPVSKDLNNLEAHHSWTDVIDTAAIELREAGVTEKYSNGLAGYLCAAFIKKQPILLVGPNAIDIVQAFSAAVTGNLHGILCCEGSYSNQLITEIGTNGEGIVMINNLFTGSWMNRLPEIISNKDIFYIITHPYSEDIQVEPKSLYGFMLPLFTEFFVDKKASGKYYGGYFAEDFKAISPEKHTRKELKVLSQFALSSMVKNRINEMITTMNGIYTETTADEEFLFGVLPIIYALQATNKLPELMADSKKGVTISANLNRDLQYVLGEI